MFTIVPELAAVPRAAWQLSPLGGITNRSYRLQGGGQDLVLRWPGDSASRYLDRRAEPDNARAAAGLGLAPRVIAADPDAGWYLTVFETRSRPLTGADVVDRTTYGAIIDLVTRLHRAPIRFATRQGLFQAIDLYLDLAPTPLMAELRRALEPARLALARHPLPLVPCHIDPNPANFLRRPDGSLLLIDWEFAAMEEPHWDLAAVGQEAEVPEPLEQALILPLVGAAQWPRFQLYKTVLNLVAASWCEAELSAGNDFAGLRDLRDARVARLKSRLAQPEHADWLRTA
ncbi:phosphotransferase [Dongia sp.]|uniref:phosphotransferase n=1 Tax=Dongia sp. TaxID=1977262 RepID=UPI0035AF4679